MTTRPVILLGDLALTLSNKLGRLVNPTSLSRMARTHGLAVRDPVTGLMAVTQENGDRIITAGGKCYCPPCEREGHAT